MYLPNIAGYASTKYALNAISLTARKELAKDKIIVSVVYPYITKTNFHKNALRSSDEVYQPESNVARERPGNRPVPDSAEHVAEHILAVIQNENAEEFVQEFLVNRE